MQYAELTEKIIGCAFKVYNQMGFGFLESVYEKCMAIELRKLGIHAEFQTPLQVFYEGEVVGDFVADVIIEDRLIIELKSARTLAASHETQLVNYLVATNKPVGLLLNFGEKKVEVKRKTKDLQYNDMESCKSCYPV